MIPSYKMYIRHVSETEKGNYLAHNKYVTLFLFVMSIFQIESLSNKLKMSQHQSLTNIDNQYSNISVWHATISFQSIAYHNRKTTCGTPI